MKRLTINWQDLELAFEDAPDEFTSTDRSNYFDLQSGNVVCADEIISDSVSRIVAELNAMFPEQADVTDDAIRATEAFKQLPEFEQPSVMAAIRMEYGDPSQFEAIPYFDSHDSYEFMQAFIETVSDEVMRRRLAEAIDGHKPFRRFRDALADDRRLQRNWNEFEMTRQREAMIGWLHSIGVEPANQDVRTYDPPPLPDLRNIMFVEVRKFVRSARDIPGVSRIALFGSLTTDKEFPKDIDVLVTVADDCDLTPLAQLARKLSGHMNAYQAGADVFLASENGDYLGRTCPREDCGPGYRASCDALHCGLRHYLHDDFAAIRLSGDAITQPPAVLWPDPSAAPNLPPDVHEQLIEQLAKDEES